MKTCVIVPTIRKFDGWHKYSDNFRKNGNKYDLLIVGEEDNTNKDTMPEGEFWGLREREKWFSDHGVEQFTDLIPKKAHAETSFGLLVAFERNEYDMIIFIDDDTLPFGDADFIGAHWKNLESKPMFLKSSNGWLNAIDPFQNKHYPRGYPYKCRAPSQVQSVDGDGFVVVNQGLWQNVPDFNAVDYLHWGSRDLCKPCDFAAANGNWLTVCSMNLAFRPEIIPAFYQLPMRENGVDRFDDIWSGVFLKKAADVLGHVITTGNPMCVHNKFTRNIFDDIRAEVIGLEINENLFGALERINLEHKTYLENYEQIARQLDSAPFGKQREYVEFLKSKMLRWTELVKKIAA